MQDRLTPEPAASSSVLACPVCASRLTPRGGEWLVCSGCARTFPSVAGIPDLRLGDDVAFVGGDQDREQAQTLARIFDDRDFAGLLRENWRLTGRPRELTERFVEQDLIASARAEEVLAVVEQERGAPLGPNDRVLEVGCGTAALAAAARRRGAGVVAGDISLRWLVLARKRLADEGLDGVELVCFAVEEAPFDPASFDLVIASDVIEHVAQPEALVAACAKLLRRDGLLFLATPNRFSLALEPHVRLWGVGYLPHRLAKAYVSAVRKTSYDHVRLLSARSLRRILRSHGLAAKLVPPAVPHATEEQLYSGLELRLVRAYNRLRNFSPARKALLAVGPFFHVFAWKGARR